MDIPMAYESNVYNSDGDCIDNWKAIRRAEDGSVISLATKDYSLIQHRDVLLPLYRLQYKKLDVSFSNDCMYAKIIMPSEYNSDEYGSAVYPLVTVRNSYHPGKSLLFEAGLYQQVCANGVYGVTNVSKSRILHRGFIPSFTEISDIFNTILSTITSQMSVWESLRDKVITSDIYDSLSIVIPKKYREGIEVGQRGSRAMDILTQHTTHNSPNEYEYTRRYVRRFMEVVS